MSSTETVVRLERLEGGALWRAVLATPKPNLLDEAKLDALARIFEAARDERELRAVLLDSDGPEFSFGASVQEHLPGAVEEMIPKFGRLFDRMLEASVPILAVVRGRCLGGGLELAAFCHRVVCAPDARLGVPEIVLGVFAPVGSVAFVERVGRGVAEDLLLSGRPFDAATALAAGLVDEVADDPSEAALAYARAHFLPRSAASLRFATRAAQAAFARRFRAERLELERLYLDELMATDDALEGLNAFLERREPSWRHR